MANDDLGGGGPAAERACIAGGDSPAVRLPRPAAGSCREKKLTRNGCPAAKPAKIHGKRL
jgi:hypothetical protein